MSNTTEKLNVPKVDAAKAAEWLEKGTALMNEGRNDEAIEAFCMGLVYDPDNVPLHFWRGRKYISTERYFPAIADFSFVASREPENWEAWYYRGVSAYLSGNYKLCQESHDNARVLIREHEPTSLPATVDWYWMASMKLGDEEAAKKVLENVYEGMPCEDGDYLARTLLYKGVYKPEGFVETQMAVIKNTERPDIYELMLSYGLANYLHYIGREEESIALLKKIRASEKNHDLFAYKQAGRDLEERGAAE